MGLRINTNVAALNALRNLEQTTNSQSKTFEQLSSGFRINRSGDDAAGLAISEKLKASIRSLSQAKRNANDAISFTSVAEGALSEASNIAIRMRELSMQASSDTVGQEERDYTNLEFQALKKEVNRIANVTKFNGTVLLNGSEEQDFVFQVGIENSAENDRLTYRAAEQNVTTDALGISDLNVLSRENAQENLSVLDSAIQNISGQRANLGALQNRLSSTISNLSIRRENLTAANSRIRDADFASQSSELTKQSILNQSGASVLLQANTSQSNALKLVS